MSWTFCPHFNIDLRYGNHKEQKESVSIYTELHEGSQKGLLGSHLFATRNTNTLLVFNTQVTGGIWNFSRICCDIFVTLDVMMCTASILNLCAISIDR